MGICNMKEEKKRYCVNCEKETPDTPCPYCGGGVFKYHKCDGGDDYGLVDCKKCEKEMLSRLNSEKPPPNVALKNKQD